MAKYTREPQAKVLADSISPQGHRLTTMEVTMHRFVLAEFNTHRVFSRNSASSRAIPSHLHRDRVMLHPAVPLEWPEKISGMQGGELLPEAEQEACARIWGYAAATAAEYAETLDRMGVHKSVTNRLLEPFLWHTVIVTSTEWDNFFGLRANELAQPEIRVPAELMQEAYDNSTPKELDHGEWHRPLMDKQDYIEIGKRLVGKTKAEFTAYANAVSAARCARVSYLTHDGNRDLEKDLELYNRLTSADPPHASPLEHVATPCPVKVGHDPNPQRNETVVLPTEHGHSGNFTGWDQLRHRGQQ